jgi:hypothetical protein
MYISGYLPFRFEWERKIRTYIAYIACIGNEGETIHTILTLPLYIPYNPHPHPHPHSPTAPDALKNKKNCTSNQASRERGKQITRSIYLTLE